MVYHWNKVSSFYIFLTNLNSSHGQPCCQRPPKISVFNHGIKDLKDVLEPYSDIVGFNRIA